MPARLECIVWTDPRSVAEIFDGADRRGVDDLVISCRPDAVPNDVIERAVGQNPSADVIAFVDRGHAARDPRLTKLLPAVCSFIAASPERDVAIVIRLKETRSQIEVIQPSQSLREFIVRLAEVGTVVFVESEPGSTIPSAFPGLCAPISRPHSDLLIELVERVQVPHANNVAMTALRAGLFLFSDLFDESHACSQSIEGEGRYHTGDYWHAILHRREPDYGNSKYWFRRVGSHPIFFELAKTIERSRPETPDGESITRARSRVVVNDAWDPYAFVDVCAAAEADRPLKNWCERVQYEEMLLLLQHSYREAAGLDGS